MAALLLFVFVFASQLIAGFNTQLPPPAYGDQVTILSIDGGGIKGIIPAVVLEYLESALKAKDPNASIAHYFDVIAGTSTGGLMTAMLTSPHPDDPTRPLFTTGEIIKFYKENGPHIFKEDFWRFLKGGPKYDGKFLHKIAREKLKETRLNQTLTSAVIPSFDLKKQQPVIFSKFKLTKLPSLDAKLSDICIGTSAAPTYLPPYYFANNDTKFNLIDGGVAASNPALVAVSEVIQQQKEMNPDFFPMRANEYTKFLLVSIGCGTVRVVKQYDAKVAARWSMPEWMISGALLDTINHATADMTDYYLSTVFQAQKAEHNYLRIQEYNLPPDMDSLDNAKEENIDNLEKVGRNLLKELVMRMNVDTFLPEDIHNGTNAEALDRIACILYKERQLRLMRKRSLEPKGIATY